MNGSARALTGFGAALREHGGASRGFVQGDSLHNLQQLVVMRNIAVSAQALTVLVVSRGIGVDLPLLPMGMVIALLAAFNLATWRRLKSARPASELELMLQLMVDVVALSLLLALAGGATNPFVGMYLLPLTITAACLPWSYTWIVALATIVCYSMLVVFFRPLFGPGEEAKYLQLLISGMWVNYAITAGMIAHFVVQISMGLRRNQQRVVASRERELSEEHLVRIGTVAAGAAHELARPLTSMAVAVGELKSAHLSGEDQRALIERVAEQLKQCQDTLAEMLNCGRHAFDGELATQALDVYLQDCIDTLHVRRPGVRIKLHTCGIGAMPSISHDLALRQGMLNLLCNAADVSPEWIEVVLDWDDEFMYVEIHDRGPGLAPEVQQQVGRLFFTTKPQGIGTGIGVCLAQTAVLRLGGTLQLANRPAGGACARITLPHSPERDASHRGGGVDRTLGRRRAAMAASGGRDGVPR